MENIDLHIHTTASDGTCSPEEVVTLALNTGLQAIAITDHDTTRAIAPAAKASGGKIEVIGGIEISADYCSREIHILGYFIDPNSRELKNITDFSVNERQGRNKKIVEKLRGDGFNISYEDIVAENPNTVIGRPHIARALINGGYVASVSEAFDRYLSEGRKYFIPRTFVPAADAIDAINKSGGIAALAHPGIYGNSDADTETMIKKLKTFGLRGVEIYYPEHDDEYVKKLLSLADKYSLFPTGGTDFHGTAKPDISIGTGRGGMAIEYKIVENLRAML